MALITAQVYVDWIDKLWNMEIPSNTKQQHWVDNVAMDFAQQSDLLGVTGILVVVEPEKNWEFNPPLVTFTS